MKTSFKYLFILLMFISLFSFCALNERSTKYSADTVRRLHAAGFCSQEGSGPDALHPYCKKNDRVLLPEEDPQHTGNFYREVAQNWLIILNYESDISERFIFAYEKINYFGFLAFVNIEIQKKGGPDHFSAVYAYCNAFVRSESIDGSCPYVIYPLAPFKGDSESKPEEFKNVQKQNIQRKNQAYRELSQKFFQGSSYRKYFSLLGDDKNNLSYKEISFLSSDQIALVKSHKEIIRNEKSGTSSILCRDSAAFKILLEEIFPEKKAIAQDISVRCCKPAKKNKTILNKKYIP